jgi:dolichyl-diphosphooligosaccharide--protein glycosyltransferase
LYWNGYKKFFTWFDYLVWYPLGRPVGTTIYPGMQFTTVWIKEFILPDWSLNDICCYVPAWFGAVATFMTGLLAYECSIPANTSSNVLTVCLDLFRGSRTETASNETNTRSVLGLSSPAVECALISMAIMAIVPAHLMRSMGGGYDNESVAVTAMVTTFYFWVRSLRATDPYSHWFGILTGLAYFYMVAAWGGYIFVLNLIGLHAAVLVAMGRFSYKVYWAYSLFYVVGTALAIQVPVVGWAPLKSLEQLGPAAIFGAYQLLAFTEYLKKKRELDSKQAWKMRIRVFGAAAVIVLAAAFLLVPKGYFGPLSARVRALFVEQTKTGNPLVDSVAEHQPATNSAYSHYLHHVCYLAPVGYAIVFFRWSDSSSFLIIWASVAYFFSLKMVRLILLNAPIGCILAGIAAGRGFAWCVDQWWNPVETDKVDPEASSSTNGRGARKVDRKGKKSKYSSSTSPFDAFKPFQEATDSILSSKQGVFAKRAVALLVLVLGYLAGSSFTKFSWHRAKDFSRTLVSKGRYNGTSIVMTDYVDAYTWLKDNTPTDSRVMAWWDYGYQIAGIANRTTIADGNTWNHEHIALLGKAFTTDLDTGWEIARHWADYVLIWGGDPRDDLAKSRHLAIIANSGMLDPTANSVVVVAVVVALCTVV